jgi:hypothetical protein
MVLTINVTPPVIRHLIIPIHNNEGELVRNMMTRKLEEDKVVEEVCLALRGLAHSGFTISYNQSLPFKAIPSCLGIESALGLKLEPANDNAL